MSNLTIQLKTIVDAAKTGGRAFHHAVFQMFPDDTLSQAIDKSLAQLVRTGSLRDVRAVAAHSYADHQEAFLAACLRGHVKMMSVLKPTSFYDDQFMEKAMTNAVTSKSLEAVRWLAERTPAISDIHPLTTAIAHNNFDMIQCLVPFANASQLSKAINFVCHSAIPSSIDQLQFLLGHMPEDWHGSDDLFREIIVPQGDDEMRTRMLEAVIAHVRPNGMDETSNDEFLQFARRRSVIYGTTWAFDVLRKVSSDAQLCQDDHELMFLAVRHNRPYVIDLLFPMMGIEDINQVVLHFISDNLEEPAVRGAHHLKMLMDAMKERQVLTDAVKTSEGFGRMGRKM